MESAATDCRRSGVTAAPARHPDAREKSLADVGDPRRAADSQRCEERGEESPFAMEESSKEASSSSACSCSSATTATGLMDLPSSLLIDVLSRLSDPAHLAAILAASRQFRALVAAVSWELRLDPSGKEEAGYVSPAAWQRAAVAMIRARMPLTRVLDLSGCSISDDDVASLLGYLRSLRCLVLDSCQKLTSSVVDALAVSVRSGPRALSLQRCFRIGPAAAGNLLAAAAADCSRLRCVLLSHLDRLELPRESPLVEEEYTYDLPRPIDKPPLGSGLRILALHNCAGLGTFELAAVAATCPLVELMFLGGSVEALGLSREEILTLDKIAIATTALVDFARSLKKLQMLELTFFTQPVIQAVREELLNEIQVWSFCEEQSLTAALCFLRGIKLKDSDLLPVLHNWDDIRDDVALALRGAANCSDIRRRTPLHRTSRLGEAHSVKCLIDIGAATKGFDSGGATPLFVAAEHGHASVCKILMESGADVFAINQAGENPMYMAALRGYAEVLDAMLGFCSSRGWNWRDSRLYGDGWTPLMAAAVADRQEIGKVLLLAGGGGGGGGGASAAARFLDSQNRHGQTALHIAVRRNSVGFVTNLLAAGASAQVQDEFGNRPLDVAESYCHRAVATILRQWEDRHGGGGGGGGGETGGGGGGRRKKPEKMVWRAKQQLHPREEHKL